VSYRADKAARDAAHDARMQARIPGGSVALPTNGTRWDYCTFPCELCGGEAWGARSEALLRCNASGDSTDILVCDDCASMIANGTLPD
jgi:hypothetical protein